jgi:ribonuclease P protein component
MNRRLTKEERLSSRAALGRVFSSSFQVGCRGTKLLFISNGLEINRVVFSPVRKFGNAVRRNRARRVGKEAYRQLKSLLKPGFDLAFILFPGDFTYGERISQFSSLLGKAGILREDQGFTSVRN